MKFAPMAIPAVALQQQHDARWDILIEPPARQHAAIEARGHSELGAQSGRENQLACLFICASTPERLNGFALNLQVTGKTYLVPRSNHFECLGQRSRSPEGVFLPIDNAL